MLNTLLGDFSTLSARIKHIDLDSSECGGKISVRASYIAFRDDRPTFDEFVDVVSDHIIAFCLPRAEIQAAKDALANGDLVAAGRTMARLSEKARQLFIKAKKGSNRSGEAGEIVLYILNEWVLKAPQIVSKMYLKTNNQMPVHGTDGIHARYDAQQRKLILYWGESKAHTTLSSALSDALDSIKDFTENAHEKREIDLVSAYADLHGMDNDSKNAILSYLDPYNPASNERTVIHSCLLIFEHNNAAGIAVGDGERLFREAVTQNSKQFIQRIKQTVDRKGLPLHRFEFFLLPVPSVQSLRDKFQAKIGWPA